ncbi:hypothetical protein ABZY57_04530 [Streptomyces sp. NPDC006450]|uniref:hypothetical protein n=1 Tax=Streptomyces sp. NPDC006450 TaxID=3155458 RepID=UPI0033BFAC71
MEFGGPYNTTFGGGLWEATVHGNFDLTRGFLVLGIDSTPQRCVVRAPRTKPNRGDVFYPYPLPTQGRAWLSYIATSVAEVGPIQRQARQLSADNLLQSCPPRPVVRLLAILVGRMLMLFLVRAGASDPAVRAEAESAVAAALCARRAILESEGVDDWKPAVASFARTYLGISRTDGEWLEAVSTALLGDWIDALGAGPPADGVELHHLRREARAVHRDLMPLWQRKSGPGRVWMLDYQFPSGETLHDLIGGAYRIEDEALTWSPDRGDACAVLGRLKEDERRIVHAFALGGGSWAEAASTAGLPPQAGERVMRKLRRLGLEHRRRRPLADVA